MPILASEPNVFPCNLLDGFTTAASERNWWAVYTKPRQEKSLARQLIALNVPVYLPLVTRQSIVKGRRMKSQVPLFSSYVFVFGDPLERIKTLETKRVVQMFTAADADELTKDLRNVRSLVDSGAALTVEARLVPGNRVRVKNGGLMGLEGVIVSRRGECRLVVAVQFLQQGVSILLDDFQVEPI